MRTYIQYLWKLIPIERYMASVRQWFFVKAIQIIYWSKDSRSFNCSPRLATTTRPNLLNCHHIKLILIQTEHYNAQSQSLLLYACKIIIELSCIYIVLYSSSCNYCGFIYFCYFPCSWIGVNLNKI